jgi:transcription termination factor Rho
MSVFTRASLEDSPLADLHTIAGELGLDGYRRLRKADLVTKILSASGSADEGPAEPADNGDDEAERPARRSRRGGRGRSAATRDSDPGSDDNDETDSADDVSASEDTASDRPARRPRGGRGGGGGGRARSGGGDRDDAPAREDKVADGVVEVLANGSGFLRVNPPDASDDDIYISGAQVRRCELVSGDKIAGPVRPPRRSERFASLVRIDTINGKPADEVSEGTPFDELKAEFPTERFALDSEDLTLKAIEWLTPIGRGSRVTITGGARAGKSEALRRLAIALTAIEGIEVSIVLAGVRPEELGLLPEGVEAAAALSFGASTDNQSQAVDRAMDAARRVAARGGHAVVLIDTLDGIHAGSARKALAAARKIVDGGSLTVIATSSKPLGGETTVVALDAALASTGRIPALDLAASGTLRPELLVGDAGAEAIASARAALNAG